MCIACDKICRFSSRSIGGITIDNNLFALYMYCGLDDRYPLQPMPLTLILNISVSIGQYNFLSCRSKKTIGIEPLKVLLAIMAMCHDFDLYFVIGEILCGGKFSNVGRERP